MIQLLSQFTGGTQIDIKFFDNMDRETDGAGLIHDSPFNSLTDPPCGIGRKTKAFFGIKFLHSPDQAEVTLFNQIKQCQPAVTVTAGDFNHQTEVTFNHTLARCGITPQGAPCKKDFFFCAEQR